MAIRYTRHARYKFEILERHGFPVTEQLVADTLATPDVVVEQSGGRYIAQKRITERHVLRVIYRWEGEDQVVITFYPGRSSSQAHQLPASSEGGSGSDHLLSRQEGAI